MTQSVHTTPPRGEPLDALGDTPLSVVRLARKGTNRLMLSGLELLLGWWPGGGFLGDAYTKGLEPVRLDLSIGAEGEAGHRRALLLARLAASDLCMQEALIGDP